jgi:hypothetical protein
MKIQRRDFLKTSLVASASAALATQANAANASAAAGRDYYDLRCYRLKADTRLKASVTRDRLDSYLEKALIPALDRRGVKNVGVFSELEINRAERTSKPKADSPVWVLIPHTSMDSLISVNADLAEDPAVLKAGAGYLDTPKADPAFERIDSWLMLAFKAAPRLTLPDFSKSRAPNRVFEMRTYESHSEPAALNKIAMFNDVEVDLMRDLGMSPIFFGQALTGPNLPHLTYMTSGADLASHLAAWAKFGPDPRWVKTRDDPKYKDNMTTNTPRFMAPAAYSQI